MGRSGKVRSLRGRIELQTLLIPAIVIVVGVAAFGLGRLSALKEGESGLVIHPAPTQQTP